jgi:hypothetical protein
MPGDFRTAPRLIRHKSQNIDLRFGQFIIRLIIRPFIRLVMCLSGSTTTGVEPKSNDNCQADCIIILGPLWGGQVAVY